MIRSLRAQMQFIWPCACVRVCVCSIVVLTGAQSVECLTFCKWNNGSGAVSRLWGGRSVAVGLMTPVSVRPPYAHILINEMHREGKQPSNNTEGAAF